MNSLTVNEVDTTSHKDYCKDYYRNNTDYFKSYYIKNRENVLHKFKCIHCSGRYTRGNKKQHFKTKKHIASLL